MSEEKVIDVEARVTPLQGTISNQSAAWLAVKHRARQGAFDPPSNPEMRGRRPSGVLFKPEEVSAEMRGTPIVQPPDDVKISKRSCKQVAEELTGRPVQVRETQTGRCEIEVVFPMARLAFEGNDWFLALASLHQFLNSRKRQ